MHRKTARGRGKGKVAQEEKRTNALTCVKQEINYGILIEYMNEICNCVNETTRMHMQTHAHILYVHVCDKVINFNISTLTCERLSQNKFMYTFASFV